PLACSLDLRLLVVAALDQHLLPVALVDDDGLQEIGRYYLDAGGVGLRVVDGHFLAAERGVDHVGGNLGEIAGILENGRILFAAQHRLDRRHFGILAAHDRHRHVAAAIADTLQRRENADGETVIGREHGIDPLAAVGRTQEVVHAGLGGGAVPAQGRDLVHALLATSDYQLAAVH